jgi:hypothetical protein
MSGQRCLDLRVRGPNKLRRSLFGGIEQYALVFAANIVCLEIMIL